MYTSIVKSQRIPEISSHGIANDGWPGMKTKLSKLSAVKRATFKTWTLTSWISLRTVLIIHFLLLMENVLLFSKGSIYDFVRIHRLHHQTFKTSDDPFYSDKDFLHSQVFSHIRKLSPRQEKLLASINMKDIEDDGIVMFQKRSVTLLLCIESFLSLFLLVDFIGFFTSCFLSSFQSMLL